MYTARKIAPGVIWSFAKKPLLYFAVYSTLITCLQYFSDLKIGLPFVPIGLIGSAVAFYIGFKNNSSYERLWEARKIWGAMVNFSRTWGAYVTSYVSLKNTHCKPSPLEIQKELLYRHIAFLQVFTCQLRLKTTWGQPGILRPDGTAPDRSFVLRKAMIGLLSEQEIETAVQRRNVATQLLKTQANRLDELFRQNTITERSYVQLMNLIQEFYNQQGASERIKNFPFPRQYAYFSVLFVWLFILLLPFGLLREFSQMGEHFIWLTIPAHVLISWVFNSMEVVGDTSENPFENEINDVPLSAICKTIEIDLRDMLNEDGIPQPAQAVNNVLM